MGNLADSLLTGIKRRILVPASQVTLTDEDMLAFADSVMKDDIVPLCIAARQNYYVYKRLVATAEGVKTYRIPERAVGRTLRDLKFSSDGSGEAQTIVNLVEIALEDEHIYAESGPPEAYYFLGDKIILRPTPNDDEGALVQFYEEMPAKLIKSSKAGRVTAVNAPTVTIAANPLASTGFTLATSLVVDIFEGISGHSTLAAQVAISDLSGLDVTFDAADFPYNEDGTSAVSIGDYIALSGYSPVIQTMDEAFPKLETLASKRVLVALGDTEGLANLEKDEVLQDIALKKLLEPRNRGETKKIVNRNGLLRGARGSRSFTARRILS
jgi:hypothetical protein